MVSSTLIPVWYFSIQLTKTSLTEYLGSINACRAHDLLAAWVLADEGRYVVDLAVDHGPAIELRVVLRHVLESVLRR